MNGFSSIIDYKNHSFLGGARLGLIVNLSTLFGRVVIHKGYEIFRDQTSDFLFSLYARLQFLQSIDINVSSLDMRHVSK